ncbi:E-selectin-like [Tachysurus vachellii]|uniref:E-selectin-like n=1 Tax=Tachysurus vachellii TaxID=175792 RepID=UPI00296AA6F1|nr:E-selectin-like [Tachysurus vachellii]
MEHRLFILLFFTGFVPFILSVPRQYYLIQQGKTWSDAQAYCRATYIDLAIIDSNDNMVRLQNEAQRQQFSSSAWIGLYNPINSWRWSMGNVSVGASLWKPGEPNNGDGHEECDVTGKQQALRVKVLSDKDVNDPAVMSAILEQNLHSSTLLYRGFIQGPPPVSHKNIWAQHPWPP